MLHCLRRYYDEVGQDSRAEAVAVVVADVQMIDELVYVMPFFTVFFCNIFSRYRYFDAFPPLHALVSIASDAFVLFFPHCTFVTFGAGTWQPITGYFCCSYPLHLQS